MPNPRAAWAILLTVLLAAAAAYAASRQRAATIITSVPYIIDRPGLYRLGADLVYQPKVPGATAEKGALIEIAAPDVTLDFQHHSLVGPDDPRTEICGVHAREQRNLLIENGRISRCLIAIFLDGDPTPGKTRNAGQRIENMLLSADYQSGVSLVSAFQCRVQGCFIGSIGPGERSGFSCGILAMGDEIELSHNLISGVTPPDGNAYGIVSNGSTGVFAIGNIVTNCHYGINAGKYKDNLTSDCGVPFLGGIDAGGNN